MAQRMSVRHSDDASALLTPVGTVAVKSVVVWSVGTLTLWPRGPPARGQSDCTLPVPTPYVSQHSSDTVFTHGMPHASACVHIPLIPQASLHLEEWPKT